MKIKSLEKPVSWITNWWPIMSAETAFWRLVHTTEHIKSGPSVLHESRSKLVESRGMMSTATEVTGQPPAAVRAGADLRDARERLGWSLDEVATHLRIRLPHLEALEEGRLSLLPGNAYALAFMRTYARTLGLDDEEIVRRFKAEAAEVSRRTELDFPIPMPERGFPGGAVLLLGIVLAVGAYAGWYRLSGDGRLPAETVIAVPERLAPLAEQALPPATVVADGGSQGGVADAPQVAAASPAPPEMSVPVAAPPAEAPSVGAAQAATVAPGAGDSRIVLHAASDAWILLKDRGGAVLLNRVLKAGESWSVPPRIDLLLTTGNAGGTEILLDGAATPSIGASGAVRRDLPLDPQAIKDGKLVTALTSPLASTHGHQ
jgi:cytoskeleton protein RodZ